MVVHLFLNNNKALDFLPINSIKNGGITVEGITALLVSSQLKNGDEIIDTFNNSVAICIFKDQLTFQNSLSHD